MNTEDRIFNQLTVLAILAKMRGITLSSGKSILDAYKKHYGLEFPWARHNLMDFMNDYQQFVIQEEPNTPEWVIIARNVDNNIPF